MHIQQAASAEFPLSSRVQAVVATLARALKLSRTDIDAAQSDVSGSRLDRPLRYDIGEIDYDPRRIGSTDNPGSHELRLWLHHYPR